MFHNFYINVLFLENLKLKSLNKGKRQLKQFTTLLVFFPSGAIGKEFAFQCRRHKGPWFDPWVRKIPWRRAWHPTPVFLPGESQGQRTWWATVHRVTKSQTQLK